MCCQGLWHPHLFELLQFCFETLVLLFQLPLFRLESLVLLQHDQAVAGCLQLLLRGLVELQSQPDHLRVQVLAFHFWLAVSLHHLTCWLDICLQHPRLGFRLTTYILMGHWPPLCLPAHDSALTKRGRNVIKVIITSGLLLQKPAMKQVLNK